MKQTTDMKNILLITGLIGVAALSRFLPHPPNFTAIGAMALFGGAMYKNKIFSFLVPVVALWTTDLIINNVIYAAYTDGFMWMTQGGLWIIAGIIAISFIGMGLIKKIGVKSILSAGVLGSIAFFLLSNIGAWLTTGMYPATFSGLIACYVAALPFFLSTIAGTLFYSGVLFGAYYWVTNGYTFKELQIN